MITYIKIVFANPLKQYLYIIICKLTLLIHAYYMTFRLHHNPLLRCFKSRRICCNIFAQCSLDKIPRVGIIVFEA